MPISADLTQIAIVEEATYGTTPANPVFLVMNITGESLAGNAQTQISNALNSSRQIQDSFLNGLDVSGSLDFEFSKSTAMTLLFESAMGDATVSATTNRDIRVGNDQISFTIEKRFEDASDPGVYLYHRYTGCVVNTLSLTMSAGSEVTGSAGIIGKELTTDTVIITGATYPAVTVDVFRAPDIDSIVIDNVAGTLATAISTACITDTTISLNNNYRGIQCLGTLGNKEVVIGTFECSYSQTIFFSHSQLMDDFLDQVQIDEVITLGDDTTDNHYVFTTTNGKVSSNNVVAGGQGTDVVNACEITWLYDSSLGTPTTIQIHTAEGL